MNQPKKMNKQALCPDCHSRVVFHKNPRLNQLITCKECGELLEVVELTPLKLDWAFDYDYDTQPVEPNGVSTGSKDWYDQEMDEDYYDSLFSK